jgi:hypothetical protein
MEEIEENIPNYKIYRDKAMYGAAYLGGPLAAGYIIAENFKAFGNNELYKRTWIITIISTIIIFTGVFFIPDSFKIPNFVIPLFYTAIASILMHQFQGEKIAEHQKKGGKVYSGWRVFLVGLIGISIVLAIVFPIAYFMNSEDYSESVILPSHSIKHELNYNPDHIKNEEVQFLGKQLLQMKYLDSLNKTYLYIDKKENTIKISVSLLEKGWLDSGIVNYYKYMQYDLKLAYEKKNFVEILLCDSALEVKDVLR